MGKVSEEEFIEKYEKPNKPVIITNFSSKWGSKKAWTWSNLYKKYKNKEFKLGESDKGKTLRVKFKKMTVPSTCLRAPLIARRGPLSCQISMRSPNTSRTTFSGCSGNRIDHPIGGGWWALKAQAPLYTLIRFSLPLGTLLSPVT